ncbi:MAG: glycosyltransferase [Gemmatimonadales bacterium]
MMVLALILLAIPVGLFGYSYFLYPAILWLVGRLHRPWVLPPESGAWPVVSISLPAYNEERSIRRTIENQLAIDYPADRRQIMIISDASTDRTDEIVREYADRGVELLRLPARAGKTAAENAAGPLLRGDIVINTDATIRILPESVKPLVRAFLDPSVGVASGRDLSVGDITTRANMGESRYVGYEMGVRRLETRVAGIVGASGCFYGIRRSLHLSLFPEALSRDFASALIAREHRLRAVSVDEAICLVPRGGSLPAEYRRKVRTMARGLETLWYKRHLLNPRRHGVFAWMLASHKLTRWLVFLTLPVALTGLLLLAVVSGIGRLLIVLAVVAGLVASVGYRVSERRKLPRPVAMITFLYSAMLAGFMAWVKALRGERNPIWEPTRRP